jgi:hypothetical protein
MSQRTWVRSLSLALFLLLALAFGGALPAFASSAQAGDQICTGNNLTLASGQTVRNILAFGCNVEIQQGATVLGSLSDFGGNIRVAGTVNGSIVAFGGNIFLTETAVVGGEVATMGGSYSSAPGAVVRGNASGNTLVPPVPPTPISPLARPFSFQFDLLGGIVTALAFAALGALVVIFAPNATKRVSDAVQAKPLNTAGVGCLTLLVLPILGILLIITLIGIPVALLLALVSWAAWIFGGIAIGLLAGEKILNAFKVSNVLPVVAVILGVIVLMLIGQIPIFGWLVSCIVGLFGLGAVVLTRFGTRAYPPLPTMTMIPAAATAASAPGTFTPSAADVAAWEAKAREATNAQRTTPPPVTSEPQTEERKSIEPPSESGETKPPA